MRIDMTVEDYQRLTGRCYELHERFGKRRAKPAVDKAPAPDEQEPEDSEEDPEEDPEAEVPAAAAPPGAPGAAPPAKPKPKPSGKEEPLAPNVDGFYKSKGKWPTLPTNSTSA